MGSAITYHELTRRVNHHTNRRDDPVYIRSCCPSKYKDTNRSCYTGKDPWNEACFWVADAILHCVRLVYEPDETAINDGTEEAGYHESGESNSHYAQREPVDTLVD